MLDRFILHNARRLGHKPAFGSLMKELSFAQLEASISRLARALQGLREYSPRLVVVQAGDTWRHWMLILALGRLGLASASLTETSRMEAMSDILAPDLFLVYQSTGYVPPERQRWMQKKPMLVLDDKWFETVLNGYETDSLEDVFLPVPVRGSDLCRVAVITGTDREMRSIGYNFAETETAFHRLIYQDIGEVVGTLTLNDRLPDILCTIDPASISGFLMVGGGLAAGATVRFTDDQNIGHEVSRSKGLMGVLTPVHLEHLLKTLPPGMKPLKQLHLTVVGAPLSKALLEATWQHLTAHVTLVYGTDEVGLITGIPAEKRQSSQSVGRVLPWVSMQIIDDQGNILPEDQEGILRIMAAGPQAYLTMREGSTQNFREGWFYPGDRGFLTKQGELYLTGRIDDLVAIGGGKFDLGLIDRMACEEECVDDAGSFVFPAEDGRQHLYCAFVTHDALDLEVLVKRLRNYYADLPPLTAIWVKAIPYHDSGHIDRDKLMRSYARHLQNEVNRREI